MKLPLYTRKDSKDRGRHLVASQSLHKHELIFVERPLVALQSLDNIPTNIVCRHCRAFCCSTDIEWGLASGRLSRRNVVQDDSCLVACRQDCGQVYCSEECKADAWQTGGHALLCTGRIEQEDHPLIQFKIHAMQHNEIFIMVADVVVGMMRSPESFREKMEDFSQVPWWHVATEPLLKSPTGLAEAACLQTTLQRLCQESSTLLKQALLVQQQQQQDIDVSLAMLDELCTAESFGKIIGSFEQNAIGIRQPNPLCRAVLEKESRMKYRKDLISCLQQAGMMDDIDSNVENDTDNNMEMYSDDEIAHVLAGLEEEEDSLFVPLDGTAMYATACKMNHSCAPNVTVLYKPPRDRMPLVAYCVALSDINEGEELCISYIDSSESLEARQEALENYGFKCACYKCLQESSGSGENGVPNAKEDEEDLDEDELFGPEDDDESDEGDRGDTVDEEVDGETALQRRRMELDQALNESVASMIPVNVLAIACNYVIRVGSAAVEQGLPEDYLQPLLQECLAAVRERDFVQCCKVGSVLEVRLYNVLEESGSWPDMAHRQAYGSAALASSIGNLHVGSLLTAQTMLDKAFILGLPRDEISDFFSLVEHFANQAARGPCPPAIKCNVDCSINEENELISLEFPIPEVSTDISSQEFESQYVSQAKAGIVRGFASDWTATTKWRDLKTLVQSHGHRLVPIELGTMMKSGGMKEQIIKFRLFVESFLVPSCQKSFWALEDATDGSSPVAYLAQHPLLDQIPELCRDIAMSPRLCNSPPSHRNVWMGTGGTRTPLHFDSYDNLLVQIVGYKYVRVYDTRETENLYVIRGAGKNDVSAQGNMSAINCELEDFEEHPLARNAEYQEVYLGPGDCLFLPARMWHYVRSLSTSISVNYWW